MNDPEPDELYLVGDDGGNSLRASGYGMDSMSEPKAPPPGPAASVPVMSVTGTPAPEESESAE